MYIKSGITPKAQTKTDIGFFGFRFAVTLWVVGVVGYAFLIFQRSTGIPTNIHEYVASPGPTLMLAAEVIANWLKGASVDFQLALGSAANSRLLIASGVVMAVAMTGIALTFLQFALRWFFFETGFLALSFVAVNWAAGADATEIALALILLALTAYIVVKLHSGTSGYLRFQQQN